MLTENREFNEIYEQYKNLILKAAYTYSGSYSAAEQFLEDELQKQRLELHEKIFTNLMEKNERWYDAIVLVYYMEMPQAKAAELMGIRLEVLHSLLHRAKKWIKKKYGTEYEEMNRED